MMETGKMTIVVALVHIVYLKGLDTERFTLEDGKMTKDTCVYSCTLSPNAKNYFPNVSSVIEAQNRFSSVTTH